MLWTFLPWEKLIKKQKNKVKTKGIFIGFYKAKNKSLKNRI